MPKWFGFKVFVYHSAGDRNRKPKARPRVENEVESARFGF